MAVRPLGEPHPITVGGTRVDEATYIDQLARGDREAESMLLRQLREDVSRDDRYSLALVLIQRTFRAKIVGWFTRDWFAPDVTLAEEAWDDVLYRIWTRIGGYTEERSALRTWIWNQARYAALDLRRRPYLKRETTFPGDDEGGDTLAKTMREEAQRGAEEPPTPVTGIEGQAIRHALRRLTKTEKWLLRLHYVYGFGYAEMAHRGLIDLPEEHVRVYVHRAVKRLRRFYEQELESLSERDA